MVPQEPSSTTGETPARRPDASSDSKASTQAWQKRLLPLMTGILVGLTIFFFITTLIQLAYLNYNILQIPDVQLRAPVDTAYVSALSAQDAMDARKLDDLAILEAYVVARRYHQAGVQLSSQIWLRYLGFVTGMILALVGASFVLGKLQEPASELTSQLPVVNVSLRTASPGLILAVLGVILMFATITDRDTLDITDKRIYLPSADTISAPLPSGLPTLKPTNTPAASVTPVPGK